MHILRQFVEVVVIFMLLQTLEHVAPKLLIRQVDLLCLPKFVLIVNLAAVLHYFDLY